ncbi:MAG: HU family DNA-binding protein [Deltaproteobacteria bacterium]|nr:HU family DNA-binding protein [Deltaproteobacteria bacterium]
MKKGAAAKVASKVANGKKEPQKKVEAAAKPAPTKFIPKPPTKPVLVVPKNDETKQYTQSEFLDCVQNYCGFNNRRQTKEFYDDFMAVIQNGLKSGYKIPLPGLGKLQVRKTKARMGRNPATQQPMMIPARKKIAFTANKALKEAVL